MPGVLRVGLTGGIACGRSTVGRFIGAPQRLVIDADAVAHELMAAGGAAVEEIAAAFGEGVRAGGGGLSRPALAAIVFGDAAARRRLESILHPRILAEIDARTEDFERRHGTGVVVADAALMIETGTWRRYHRIVVVHCPREVQRARLMARDALTAAEADARIAAQLPLEAKRAVADYLIDTGGTMDETRENALRVAALLDEDAIALPSLAPRRGRAASC